MQHCPNLMEVGQYLKPLGNRVRKQERAQLAGVRVQGTQLRGLRNHV
jgi:hypothetical protein